MHSPPQKKIKSQTQQSAEDTTLCQKIGNTQIVIEQVNSGAKMLGHYFNSVIPMLQLDLAPVLMRVCYLMQKFHPAFSSMDNRLRMRMRMKTKRVDHAEHRFDGMEPAMVDW
jgi:hypothetical protein